LTKLYLAVNVISNKLLEKIKEQKDRKFGLLLYDKGNFEKILDAPKLKINYDMFAYMHPEGGKITVYESGKPNSIKTVDFPHYKYANGKGTKKFFRERLKFYKLIYAGLSRRGISHGIEVISQSDRLAPNLNKDDSYEE
jgi:hypothetical protein